MNEDFKITINGNPMILDNNGVEYDLTDIEYTENSRLVLHISKKEIPLEVQIIKESEKRINLYKSKEFKDDAIKSGMTEEVIEDLINSEVDHYNYLLKLYDR